MWCTLTTGSLKFAAEALKYKHKLPIVATIHATEFGRNYGIHSDMQRHISHLEWELSYEAWRIIVCSEFMKAEVNRCSPCRWIRWMSSPTA